MNDFERDVLEIFRGWDKYEKETSRKNENPVIDFDVAPPTALREFRSRSEILATLKNLLNQASNTLAPTHLQFKRIRASIAYLRRIMGENISFPNYIELTIGFRPHMFSLYKLQSTFGYIDSRLKAQGLAYHRRFRDKYFEQNRIQGKAEIERCFLKWKDSWLTKLGENIVLPSLLDFNVEWACDDVFWSFWVSATHDEGLVIKINVHPRHYFSEIMLRSLSAHKVAGHAVQMCLIKERIEAEELPPYFGVTCVHQPEAYQMEGLAQTLPFLIMEKEEIGEDLLLRKSIEQYQACILANAHHLINMGIAIEDVIRFVVDMAQFMELPEIESEIRDRSLDPMLSTYQYCYAHSYDYYYSLALKWRIFVGQSGIHKGEAEGA